METVLKIVEGFCQVSGQIVNVGKTKVFLSHDPSQEEIEMLESLGLSKEKFILPRQRIKIVGYEFRVNWNLRANSIETLGALTEDLKNRIAGWNTVSRSFEGRKVLSNTILGARVCSKIP